MNRPDLDILSDSQLEAIKAMQAEPILFAEDNRPYFVSRNPDLKIVVDENMPEGTMEFRDKHGKLLSRITNIGAPA